MNTVAELFRAYAQVYIERFGGTMSRERRKVVEDIAGCRTPAAGTAVYGCATCGEKRFVHLGCGNRHCPNCQRDKSRRWLERALAKVLPGVYFLVTFTVPAELRSFLRRYRREGYGTMFTASAETLKGVLANPKYCGTDLPGFFGVLHTWSRRLEYHPHIHNVLPGGGLDRESGLWRTVATDDYLAPGGILSRLYRAKFLAETERLGLLDHIPRKARSKAWNVHVQPVGRTSEGVIKYLAPYVFRVAIADSRVVGVENDMVTFTYKSSATGQLQRETLHALEFIHRFLQHVLPR